MERQRGYVFGAGKLPENEKVIKAARIAAENIDLQFRTEEDCVEHGFHSSVDIIETDKNFEIYLENTSVLQLCQDCMQFAYEYTAQTYALYGVFPWNRIK